MLAKIFDNFIVHSIKDKKAPSFLFSFILAWSIYNFEFIRVFLMMPGTLDIKFRGAFAIHTDQTFPIWIAFVLLFVRPLANNIGLIFKESLNKTTQLLIKSLRIDTYPSNETHDAVLEQNNNLRNEKYKAVTDAEESEKKYMQSSQQLRTKTEQTEKLAREIEGIKLELKKSTELCAEYQTKFSNINKQHKLDNQTIKELSVSIGLNEGEISALREDREVNARALYAWVRQSNVQNSHELSSAFDVNLNTGITQLTKKYTLANRSILLGTKNNKSGFIGLTFPETQTALAQKNSSLTPLTLTENHPLPSLKDINRP